MQMRRLLPPILVASLATASLGINSAASAQTATQRITHRALREDAVPYRGLTITRPPDDVPDPYNQDDSYRDGPIRYNDIRHFSPFPYADSGRQLPFGFDGIGGYGSDLGYNEGQDAALYNRGAFNGSAD